MLHVEAGGAHARPFVTHHNTLDMDAVPAHRARAAPQAADRRRHGAGVRDRPHLPQRGHLAPAQPRVHDDGAVPGVRRRHRRDGDHRGSSSSRPPATRSARRSSTIRGERGRPRRAVAAAPDGRSRVSEAIGAEVHPSHADRRSCARSPTGTASRYEPAWGAGQAHRGAVRGAVRGRPRRGRRSSPVTRSRSRRSPASTATTRSLTERFELFVDCARARQRLLRAQRPGRAAAALRGGAGGQGRRRRRARHGRRGLPARPRVRHAADRRARHRHRPRGRCCSPASTSIREVILFPTLRPEVVLSMTRTGLGRRLHDRRRRRHDARRLVPLARLGRVRRRRDVAGHPDLDVAARPAATATTSCAGSRSARSA